MSQTDLTIVVFAYLIVLAQGIFLFIDAKKKGSSGMGVGICRTDSSADASDLLLLFCDKAGPKK